MNFFRKTILFLVIFLLIFNSSGFLKSGFLKFIPPKAEAVWWSTLFQQLADYALKIWEWIKENWQKLMRDIIAKRIIDYIVDETIKWINGGGDPKFVTDWKGFLDDAGKIAQDSIIKQVGLAPLCGPFKLQVQIGLLPVKKFSQRIECTLDDIVGNINDFYNDFSKGGWVAYSAMWEPQNNFFGASIIAYDEALKKAAKEIESRKNDAQSGKGFLSWKTCEGGGDQQGYCNSTCNQWYSADEYQDCYDYCMATPMSEEELCQGTGGKMQTKTPGSVISAVTDKSQTSDIEWAANIDSWVSALINAVINRLIKEGVSELNNSNNQNYSQQSYYPPEYAPVRGGETNSNNQMMIDEINGIANGWRQLLNFKQSSLNSASSTLAIYLELEQRGCSVSQNEIDVAQSEVNRLAAEVAVLSSKIAEANDAISQIMQGGTNGQTAYFSFMNKYNNSATRAEIDPDNINLASSEMNQKATEEAAAQARLSACQFSSTATSTP